MDKEQRKEFARNLRENAVVDEWGIVLISQEVFQQIIRVIEEADEQLEDDLK